MLTIHRAERADRLVAALADVLATPLDDPFRPEVVAVPSKGVERWITQTLALRLGVGPRGADGVCALVDFPSPSRLAADCVARAADVDPETDPWSRRRLPWSVLAVVDDVADQEWCWTLGRHLGVVGDDDPERVAHRRGRRSAVAHKLARLFTAYSEERPELVRAVLRGDDTGFPADLGWQAELLRRVRDRIGAPAPAERLDAAVDRLRDDPAVVVLPPRLSLFGPTRLSAQQRAVVAALGVHRDVRLWLPHPSPALWERVAADLPALGPARLPRSADPTAGSPRHPLLRSLGRDVRELQAVLRTADSGISVVHHTGGDRSAGGPPARTLLAALQDDLRQDRRPSADHALAPRDRSVQVHACHGRMRQVEVLRDVLLGLLQDTPGLEPRDIVVMCPDIEAFAPFLTSAFGPLGDAEDLAPGHPAHRLQIRLADRSLRETNPVVAVLARVLELADARVTATQVLDLAALAPVRRRYALDDETLERVAGWVREAQVRWGLDAEARAPYRLEGVPENTWYAGLSRLLLGVAMDEDDQRTFGGVLPLDDVDSNDIDAVGRFAELVTRLGRVVGDLSGRRSLVGWVELLDGVLDDFVSVSWEDGWQLTEARRQLAAVVEAAAEDRAAADLGLADLRSLLADRLQGRPTRANFRTGHLTACSMVPMRSVPHRVVVLLGLDDRAFPRHTHLDGDDVLLREPLVGERDIRTEDRQLFLDALLAAEQTLVALYSGFDERTGAERPPAVPLGELLDVLDRTATASVRETVVVRHPLQPFDARTFRPGGLVRGAEPFGFDPSAARGAQAAARARAVEVPFLDGPLLPRPRPEVVELADVVSFLEHPVRSFLRTRLGIAFPREDDAPADALAVDLDGLASWKIGDRLLQTGLAGGSRETALAAEVARGGLPPGPLGRTALEPILGQVDQLVSRSLGLRVGDPVAVDVDVTLPSGIRLLGTVPGVHGACAVHVAYSRLKPKLRLRGWVWALALTASDPSVDWRTMVAGREAGRGRGIDYSSVGGLEHPRALLELDRLVDLVLRGLEEPLPLLETASSAYATRRDKGAPVEDAEARAADEWRRTAAAGHTYGEYDDVHHRCVWGETEFATLLEARPTAEERAWAPDEPSRFGVLARRLWSPVLELAQGGTS